MATELNVEVLSGMGFDVPEGAGANDLVSPSARLDDAGVAAGLAAAEAALAAKSATSTGGFGERPPPRTMGGCRARRGEPTSRSSPCRAATPRPRPSTPSRPVPR